MAMSLQVIHTLRTITDESECDVNDACTTNWGFRFGVVGKRRSRVSSYFPQQLNGKTAAPGLRNMQSHS